MGPLRQPIGTAGTREPPSQRPHKNSIWYGTRPPGLIQWEGPGWYALAAKNTRLIRVG
jgi:hypothetical protein